MAAHLEDEDRQGQHRRAPEIAAEPATLGILPRLGLGICRTAPFDRVRCVARPLDCPDQGGGIGTALHGRTLGRQVHAGLGDAGHGAQRAFDAADAGGAGHPLDGEFRGRGADRVACALDRADQIGPRDRRGETDLRAFRGKVHAGVKDARHPLQGPFDTADTGGAGHPLDGERDRLGGDFR